MYIEATTVTYVYSIHITMFMIHVLQISGRSDFSDYYDKFSVSLAGMQVLVAKPGTYAHILFFLN